MTWHLKRGRLCFAHRFRGGSSLCRRGMVDLEHGRWEKAGQERARARCSPGCLPGCLTQCHCHQAPLPRPHQPPSCLFKPWAEQTTPRVMICLEKPPRDSQSCASLSLLFSTQPNWHQSNVSAEERESQLSSRLGGKKRKHHILWNEWMNFFTKTSWLWKTFLNHYSRDWDHEVELAECGGHYGIQSEL